MKKTLLFTSILMIAGAMNVWADCESNYPYDCVHGSLSIKDTTTNGKTCYKAILNDVFTDDELPNASFSIDKDIENVCAFEYNRDFSGNSYDKPSTMMLPFSVAAKVDNKKCFEGFGDFYKLTKIEGLERYQIIASEADTIKASTPYFMHIFGSKFAMKDYCYPVVLNATNGNRHIVNIDKWEFTGTYSYKKWEEGNPDIGFFYGFAAKSKEVVQADGKTKSVSQGQFVKGKAGAFIKPARAYLIYNQNSTAAANRPSMYGVKSVSSIKAEDLPETIDVIFQDENGETTSIAQMNTVTGEFTSVTGWYDMKGRKLNKKPTQKGTYFNNGKKVVIK